ncbi:exocyst complex component Sec3-domain-containing protein [Dactylonectria macrodidyma]|uniref:Exocyst complex component Sec3-domain-containing protein n=1 Tax=Dactylonectria macrodidyma TaxID=307937 RepID=A0A9P9FGR6_9HYPO|nr:exocyst complex component Sec3-domain-containing protein [Dactylonectria macrodidyma]
MDRANGGGPSAAINRAERFEDEKRRIVDSCFNKKDVDGSLLETYITHIRIVEYSSYPSSPPPPQARTPETQKPRAIIVAVRKSGRVRMHKSKENANGTFSIGKTWNLDDLSHIESYTGPQVNPTHREWVGDTGFLVTLGKPYFWQAQTDKEKKFFIASLIKIYGKYTGGKTPELVGFDNRELDQVMGGGRRPPAASARPPPPLQPEQGPNQPSSSSSPSPRPGPPSMRSNPENPRYARTPPIRPPINGTSSPAGSMDSNASRDRPPQPPWMAQGNRSQDSVANSIATRSDDGSSLPPRSRNGMQGPGSFGRFGEPPEPRTAQPSVLMPPQPLQPSQPPAQLQAPPQLRPQAYQPERPPPERRRPPMDPTRPHDRDLVPPPLISPSKRPEPMAPPPRSAARKDSTPGTSMTGSFNDREIPSPASRTSELARPDPPLPLQAPQAPPALKPPSVTSLPKFASPASSPAMTARSAPTPPPEPAAIPPVVAAVEPPVEAPIVPPAETTPKVPPEPSDDSESSRPGLGPMIRAKKSRGEIAGAFWKAASAASVATAFKPRPGGAGERLRQAQNKSEDGPDGITGVVPAPPRAPSPVREISQEASRDASPSLDPPKLTEKSPRRGSLVPEVKISVPRSRPTSSNGPVKEVKPKERKKAEPQRSVTAGNDSKYLQTLGVDPSILDNRSDEFCTWLDHFGWIPGKQMRTRNIEEMKTDLERELNQAQAGGWLARFREEDERVEAIKYGMDLAMAECEELDNLLTLYSVELSTLSDDIAYIEAQGQGLQVQTANQKLLKRELESLLETCAITSFDLEALKIAPLDNIRGLADVETALVTLFRAMKKMDPTLSGDLNSAVDVTMDSDQTHGLNSDYGQMRIVREKKEMYIQESGFFMRRLSDFISKQFDAAFTETKLAMEGALSRKVDSTHHDLGRDLLWKYHPLMLYAREVDLDSWNGFIQVYQDKSLPVYRVEFQNVIAIWRKNARKLTGEETELLFSSQAEKHEEKGVATTARKLTVKRSQTLARALRSPLADSGNRTPVEKTTSDSRSLPYEVFAGVLDDLLPLVQMEQNFIVDFFHATTLEQVDFPDLVAACAPRDRRGGDLKRPRLMEPDRELARRVTRSMELIFTFLEQELLRLMEWGIGQDPLQGVGVLATLEKKLGEISQSNQDFLNTLLQKMQGHLDGRFKKFVDEQIRAIEDTKVKIKKRKGVISFFRVFPTFSAAVENMMVGVDPQLSARRMIDREYDRLLKTMFDSLMVIARENPAVSVTNGAADPEDKEALNFHILLIENMNHFLEETDTHGLDVLEEWKEQANTTYYEHMGLYLNAAMRRPLGKVLEHLENMEAQLQSGKSASSIAAQPSNSKAVFNKVLSNYDAKEVRKGIEALRKRVEKHFGDADDPALSRGLVVKALTECEQFYEEVEARIGRVTTDVYGGDVLFEWPRADVKAAFR